MHCTRAHNLPPSRLFLPRIAEGYGTPALPNVPERITQTCSEFDNPQVTPIQPQTLQSAMPIQQTQIPKPSPTSRVAYSIYHTARTSYMFQILLKASREKTRYMFQTLPVNMNSPTGLPVFRLGDCVSLDSSFFFLLFYVEHGIWQLVWIELRRKMQLPLKASPPADRP